MKLESYKQISSRIAMVGELLASCTLCPRKCGVNRIKGETGYCGLDAKAYCFREMRGFNEEHELLPAHQVYLAGCNLRCAFCSVAEWNMHPRIQHCLGIGQIAGSIAACRKNGVRTVIMIGGEPSVSVLGALKILRRMKPDTHIAWKTNMYFNPVMFDLLDGLVDVYVADFKCGRNSCSESILQAKKYAQTVKKNLLAASRHGDLIIRHLLIPGHWHCCAIPILRWIKANIPDVKLSLRGNYAPPVDNSGIPNRFVTNSELAKALDCAHSMKLNVII
jgi:putative pyruvate formate lyase activating enzyme